MSSPKWSTLDTRAIMKKSRAQMREQTVAANAGAYPVPLGGKKKKTPLLRKLPK